MDIASLLGILIGIGSLAFGYTMDGGSLQALWLLSAFIIIIGGSLGSVALSSGIKEIVKIPKLMLRSFINPKSTLSKTIDYIVELSENARKNGLLSLENMIADETKKEKSDPLLKQGILMVIDGIDLEQIKETLETELYVYEENAKTEIAIFESLGTYAPAFGMIGTIMGLIKVLSNMSSPGEMTSAIAVAFTTTLYGVLFANVLFLPIANKLRKRMNQYLMEQEVTIEGICSIRNGINPKMLRDKLSIYVKDAPSKSGKAKSQSKEEKIGAKKKK